MTTVILRRNIEKNKNMKEKQSKKINLNELYAPVIKHTIERIETTLGYYGITVKVAEAEVFPDKSIQYRLQIQVGTVISDIEKRKREIALAIASTTGTVKIQAPIPGRSLIGITVPEVPLAPYIQKPNQGPKTILGKGIKHLANLFKIISVILNFTVEAFENRKDIANQLLVIIIVPIVITVLVEGKFDVLRALDYFLVSFIVWLLILGVQQYEKDKSSAKKDKK